MPLIPEYAGPIASTGVAGVLEDLRRDGLYRELRVIDSPTGPEVMIDGARVTLLCSNDYLGLASHPEVRRAAAEAAEQWGAGTGSSRLVAGSLTPHHQLERELADFKGHASCVLFGSGYLANVGVIGALAGRGDVILSDALNHASIIDGCRQSRAETIVYAHCDPDSLADGLRRAGGRRTLIVTDAVFSMDGDCAPLQEIVELAERYQARVVVDEAHATGVLGRGGRGLVAALGLQSRIDVVVGTLSKALASYGAFACCRPDMASFLINRARTLIYSTSLPPPSIAAARAALGILRDTPEIIDRLGDNAQFLRSMLTRVGFGVTPGATPIIPLIVGQADTASALASAALRNGVFAQAIRPPTVPAGTARLRLVAMATHNPDELRQAATALACARDRVCTSQ